MEKVAGVCLLEDEEANLDTSKSELEEKAAVLWDTVNAMPACREVLYQMMLYCVCEQERSAVEKRIASCQEMQTAIQTPYQLVSWLLRDEGLEEIRYLDGSVMTVEQATAYDEDPEATGEIRMLQTTKIGLMVVEKMNPSHRVNALIREKPEYKELFLEVIDFCRSPKTLQEIKSLLELDPLVATYRNSVKKVYPSYFLDRLQKSGCLSWDKGWKATTDALAYLEQISA